MKIPGRVSRLAAISYKKTWLLLIVFAAALFGLQHFSTYNTHVHFSPHMHAISVWSTWHLVIGYIIYWLFLGPLFFLLIMGKMDSAAKRNHISLASLLKRFLPFLPVVLLVSVFAIIYPHSFIRLLIPIPSAVLLAFFGMAQPIVLFEGKNPWQAIKRSCQLVWGNWWYAFFTFLIGQICITLLLFLLYLIMSGWLSFVIFLFNIPHHTHSALHTAIFVFGPIFATFIGAQLSVSLVLEIYYNLRLRYESKGNYHDEN